MVVQTAFEEAGYQPLVFAVISSRYCFAYAKTRRDFEKKETQLEKDSTGTDPLIHGFERTEFAEVARDRLIIQRLPLPLPGLRAVGKMWKFWAHFTTFYDR